MKLARALRALPETGSLAGLREALIADSHQERASRWSGSREYATLEQRESSAERLLARLPELVERQRERSERKLRHSVQALQALEGGDEAGAARELVSAGEVAEAARELEEAAHFFEAAIALGRRPRDRTGEALARLRLARVQRALGALDRALAEYRRGWEISSASGDPALTVVACTGAGNVLVDRGEWERAREWYRRGLEQLRGGAGSRQEWELHSNLAIVARRMGDLDESAASLDRARRVAEAIGDAAAPFFLDNGDGRIRIARGDGEGAEAAFRRALAATDGEVHRTLVFVNLAEALLLQGRLRDAEEVARKAEEMALVHRVGAALPEIYRLLGAVAREEGRRDGFVFFEQALALLGEEPVHRLERALTQHSYALFQIRMGDVEMARARLREAIATFEQLSASVEAVQSRQALRSIDQSSEPRTGSFEPASPQEEAE